MAHIEQPTLIVTGMHRSGTSLISSLLQSAGLNIGKNLVAGNEGNIKGHFENKDFVDFHEKVLYSLGINEIGWTLEKDLSPPPAYQDDAKSLIESSLSLTEPWGWKDPRTSLFLNFWHSLIPNGRFLFIYRSPWEVLDSLFRRGDDIFHRHPEFALQIWMSYNQQILDFYHQHPENCLLLNLNQVTQNPDFLIEQIATKLQIELSQVDRNLYEAKLLKQLCHNSQRPSQIKQFFASVFAFYEELNHVSGYEDKIISDLTEESGQGWLLQDWLDVKRIEKQLAHEKKDSTEHLDRTYQEIADLRHQLGALEWNLQQSQQESTQKSQELDTMRSHFEEFEQEFQETQSYLQQELEQTRQYLNQSQEDFNQVRSHLTQTAQELTETRSHLTQTAQELTEKTSLVQKYEQDIISLMGYFDKSQQELKQTQDELYQVRSHLTQTVQELTEKINAMENSKFWKMRNKWFQIKKGFNLTQ